MVVMKVEIAVMMVVVGMILTIIIIMIINDIDEGN